MDDDLSQEEDGREEKPSKPQTQGEIEVFHSQGFSFVISERFVFKINFTGN